MAVVRQQRQAPPQVCQPPVPPVVSPKVACSKPGSQLCLLPNLSAALHLFPYAVSPACSLSVLSNVLSGTVLFPAPSETAALSQLCSLSALLQSSTFLFSPQRVSEQSPQRFKRTVCMLLQRLALDDVMPGNVHGNKEGINSTSSSCHHSCTNAAPLPPTPTACCVLQFTLLLLAPRCGWKEAVFSALRPQRQAHPASPPASLRLLPCCPWVLLARAPLRQMCPRPRRHLHLRGRGALWVWEAWHTRAK